MIQKFFQQSRLIFFKLKPIIGTILIGEVRYQAVKLLSIKI